MNGRARVLRTDACEPMSGVASHLQGGSGSFLLNTFTLADVMASRQRNCRQTDLNTAKRLCSSQTNHGIGAKGAGHQ